MTERRTDRRWTLKLLGGTLGVAAAGGLGTLVSCSGRTLDPEATTRVPLARVAAGERVKIDHHGWPVELQRRGATVTARVLVCTHEYCDIIWLDFEEQYHCPCHGAKFAPDGRPRRGPVSEPLTELPARVAGDEVIVGGGTVRTG